MKTLSLMFGFLSVFLTAGDQALLIGAVPQGGIPEIDLPGIEIDLNNMEHVCRKLGFSQVERLEGKNATRRGILRKIDATFARATGNDRVLIYFSGHGTQVPDNNDDEEDGLDEAWIPYDIQITDGKPSNFIRDDEIGARVQKCAAKRIYFFIDACNSGTATKGLPGLTRGNQTSWRVKRLPLAPPRSSYNGYGRPRTKGFGLDAVDNDNFVCLSAANDNEDAIATPSGSYFTLGLFEAVMDQPSIRTPNQILRYVINYIQNAGRSIGKVHTPVLTGNQDLYNENLFRTESVTPANQRVWLQETVTASDYTIAASSNKRSFSLGEELVIQVDVPNDGYLNVLGLDADNVITVLYPNRWSPDNHVYGNDQLRVPAVGADFRITAQEPTGEALVVVFHTRERINFFKDFGEAQTAFKQLNGVEVSKAVRVIRGFGAEGRKKQGYGAASFKFTIR